MTRAIASKRKPQRLFNGLAGSYLAKIKPNVTPETSITEKLRTTAPTDPRYKKQPIDTVISSADLDPNLHTSKEPLDRIQSIKEWAAEFSKRVRLRLNGGSPLEGRNDWDVHFQDYAFSRSPKLSQAMSPYRFAGEKTCIAGRGDTGIAKSIAMAAQSMPKGFSVQQMHGLGNAVPRIKMPWWIRNPTTFRQFRDGLSDDIDGEVDFGILKAYYFLRASDKAILESLRSQYVLEHGKKIPLLGRTKTGAAIKMRRRRLVESGDSLFGKPEGPQGETLEAARPTKSARVLCPQHSDNPPAGAEGVRCHDNETNTEKFLFDQAWDKKLALFKLSCGCHRAFSIAKVIPVDSHTTFNRSSFEQDTEQKAKAC